MSETMFVKRNRIREATAGKNSSPSSSSLNVAVAHLRLGSYYEIDSLILPQRSPEQLKSIRIVMVSKITASAVSLRYPSMYSLRSYFDCKKMNRNKPEKKRSVGDGGGSLLPVLDESHVMSSELAGDLLYRRITPHEVSMDRNSWNFWVSYGRNNVSRREMVSQPAYNNRLRRAVSPEGKCWSELISGGMIKWGRRLRVQYKNRHDEYQKSKEGEENSRVKDEEACKEEIEEDDDDGNETEEAKEGRIVTIDGICKRKMIESSTERRVQKAQKKETQIVVYQRRKSDKKVIDRWSLKRYKLAEKNMLKVMKEKNAVFGNSILRPELRSEARKLIGDTGLLDHLLKHAAGMVAPGGQDRFMRKHNADGAMEYWLESSDLIHIRKEAGVEDPYWTPPPGWKLVDNPTQDPVCSGEILAQKAQKKETQIVVYQRRKSYKKFIDRWSLESCLMDSSEEEGEILPNYVDEYYFVDQSVDSLRGGMCKSEEKRDGKRKREENKDGKCKREVKEDDRTFIAKDDATFRAKLQAAGLEITNILGDGNCFFRALAHQLGKKEKEHEKCRKRIVNYMKANRAKFEELIRISEEKDLDTYCDNMQQLRAWGGEPELIAAASFFQRDIFVYSRNYSEPRYYPASETGSSGTDRILLSFHGNHYNSLHQQKDPDASQKNEAKGAFSLEESNQIEEKDSYDEDDDVAGEKIDEMRGKRPTCIWWDYENAPVPNDFPYEGVVYQRILKSMKERGFTGPLTVKIVVGYKDSSVRPMGKEIEIIRANDTKRPVGSKDDQAADHHIKELVEGWLAEGNPPQNIIVMTADNGFKSMISDLVNAGHTAILVSIQQENQPNSVEISALASFNYDFRRILRMRKSSLSSQIRRKDRPVEEKAKIIAERKARKEKEKKIKKEKMKKEKKKKEREAK